MAKKSKESLADKLQRIKSTPPATRSAAEIEKYREQLAELTNGFMANEVRQLKETISRQPPHEQLSLSFMPTTMTRTSPFFPMSDQQQADRPFDKLIWETSWGKIEIKGERLSVYDETVLLGLLAIVRKRRSIKIETTPYEICKLTGIKRGGNVYRAIWNAIDMLAGATIKIETYEGKGKNRQLKLAMIGHIISRAVTDTKKISVEVDPYFLSMYADGLITNMDLAFRARIKMDIGKSIYRFLQGQQSFCTGKKEYSISLTKLCPTINIDVTRKPMYEIRRQIRNALADLRRLKYIRRWMVTKDDIVRVWKT